MSAVIKDGDARMVFVLAGRATFTVVGREHRFTFRVERAKGKLEERPWFVSVLTGPDNRHDYTFIGTIFPYMQGLRRGSGGRFRHSSRSKISSDATSVKAFTWTWDNLFKLDEFGVEFWHEGACAVCGRALTDPESVACGIGPVCRERAA